MKTPQCKDWNVRVLLQIVTVIEPKQTLNLFLGEVGDTTPKYKQAKCKSQIAKMGLFHEVSKAIISF